ncbi:Fc.00g006080.m01.CDS01 [Cosmosporella sp. VM-42]
MALDFPPIFLLPTHLQPNVLHELEGSIASLTYDIHEAEIVVGKIAKRERAMFELRRFKLDTKPVNHPDQGKKTVEVDGVEVSSPKRRRISGHRDGHVAPENEPETTQRDQDPGTIKVLRLTWLTDSIEHGELLPIDQYLLYEGKKISATAAPDPKPAPVSRDDILKRAAEDQSQRPTPGYIPAKARHPKGHAETHIPSQRPKLHHQTTSEHDLPLPLIPEFLKTTYSCQRPTPVDPPNESFIEALKNIRTIRLLHGDQVGVRAYSTTIATVAAYPYLLQNSQGKLTGLFSHGSELTWLEEVSRLPGCGAKIAELYQQWKNSGYLKEAVEAEADSRVSTLKLFYEIWGVGDTTAREFYRKGWRDLDDLVEHGWESLSRVQQIGVKYHDEFLLKIPRDEVQSIGSIVLDHARQMDPGFEMVIVGGYRRGKKKSGDVDVLLSHRNESLTINLVEKVVTKLEKGRYITHTLSLSTRNSERGQAPLPWKGETTKGSGFDTLDKALVVWKEPTKTEAPHRRVDIIVSPWKTVGCAVLGWSGGTTFQRDVRRYCKKEKGWKFDSSGIRSRADGMWVDLEGGNTRNKAPDMETAERRVFEGLGLPWRRPEERCTG